MKKFDLNIEKILENWEVCHALREVISNALDEKIITNTDNIEIFKDKKNNWHIKDFGRGIEIKHFTQNENEEKLNNERLIGKFGIGLKDALATLHRHNVELLIKSKFGDFSITEAGKQGFEQITTLHIYIENDNDLDFLGTDFVFYNVLDQDIYKAKNFFMNFSDEKILEENEYGMVLEKKDIGAIYISGVKVAEEENFLFSYNIIKINKSIKNALNRERSNVGRTAYANTVKSILLNCNNEEVGQKLIEDLQGYSDGTTHDEMKWVDIQEHSAKILNRNKKVVFVTNEEVQTTPFLIDEINNIGYTMINIPKNLKDKIKGNHDIDGNIIREFDQFRNEYNESFNFEFVRREQLNDVEKANFELIDEIVRLINKKIRKLPEIKISNTMQKNLSTLKQTYGVYRDNKIIIKREILKNKKLFISVLLHEIAHFLSKASDMTIEFENKLTEMIGIIGEKALNEKRVKKWF